MNETGFFRVTIAKRRKKKYFKYQIRNELIHKELIRKDIHELKKIVESYGFLWGITNREKAEQYKGKYELKSLQGKYGIQINDN